MVTRSTPLRRHFAAGFTLIELLVSVTIMLLIVGGGIAAFITFNDKQALRGAAKELQTYFRSAQISARSGVRPDVCDKLLSYAVTATAGSNQIRSLAVCENGSHEQALYLLPASVSVVGALNMEFQVLHGGVNNAGDVSLTNNTNTYTFSVTPGGEISDGDFDE